MGGIFIEKEASDKSKLRTKRKHELMIERYKIAQEREHRKFLGKGNRVLKLGN